jgi:capsular polysaccharide biosynthesis protein
MMMRIVCLALLLTAACLAVCGCRVRPPQYRASATILTRPSDPADLKLLQDLAGSVVTGVTRHVEVAHIANTELIRVSITTANPEQAAALCNKIAERFIDAAAEGDIERQLVEKATPPRKPMR